MKDWLGAAEIEGGHTRTLACLLAINGLRITEVCAADVTHLSDNKWRA